PPYGFFFAGQAAAPPRRRLLQSPEPLLHVADQLENLDRMRSQLLGELVLDRRRRRHEAGLVDAFDDLDAHCLETRGGVAFKLEGTRRLDLCDLVSRR